MAFRVTPEAASGGGLRSSIGHAAPKRGDRALTRNALLAGAALTSIVFVSAGVLMLGRERDIGSVQTFAAGQNRLKIALVEPAQQAQMEPRTAIARAPSGPDVRVKTAALDPAPAAPTPQVQAAKPARVPMPVARPRKADMPIVAAIPLPRERVVEKAPELSAPVTIAAVDARAVVASPPPPQPSPTRGEGEENVAVASPSTDVAAETQPDTSAQDAKPVDIAEVKSVPADTAPIPTTFGPEREPHPIQLTSYAPTRDEIFSNDITGSIGNPLRDFGTSSVPPAPARRPAPETTKAIPKLPQDAPKPARLVKPRAPTIQEKLWGSSVRLASLTPMDSVKPTGPYGIPLMPYDRQTAVYVITQKKVYLPDGTVLEAHSGLGPKMDDPDHVRIRMHGATPPHVYNLVMREALFHGVEAIRMLPIGGEQAIFGRAGILAHTYMLGPSGQSNGCVSFKDYDTFLDAFKAGKINRMAVLARLD